MAPDVEPKGKATLRTAVGAPAQPSGVNDYRVLEVRSDASIDGPGRLAAATTAEELRSLLKRYRTLHPPPAIDFAEEVVVFIERISGSSIPFIRKFQREGSVWTPVFIYDPRPLTVPDPMHPGEHLPVMSQGATIRVHVVAFRRSAVGPQFTVHLAATDDGDLPEEDLTIKVP